MFFCGLNVSVLFLLVNTPWRMWLFFSVVLEPVNGQLNVTGFAYNRFSVGPPTTPTVGSFLVSARQAVFLGILLADVFTRTLLKRGHVLLVLVDH